MALFPRFDSPVVVVVVVIMVVVVVILVKVFRFVIGRRRGNRVARFAPLVCGGAVSRTRR